MPSRRIIVWVRAVERCIGGVSVMVVAITIESTKASSSVDRWRKLKIACKHLLSKTRVFCAIHFDTLWLVEGVTGAFAVLPRAMPHNMTQMFLCARRRVGVSLS
jgi:hypothetical protein